MRSIPWLLAILAIVAVGWLARDARHRLEAMRSEVAALELVRDQALAAAGHAQARADSAAAVADSLDALRTRERADAEARARRLSREADSLETAIGAMVPEGELRTAVVEAVAGLRRPTRPGWRTCRICWPGRTLWWWRYGPSGWSSGTRWRGWRRRWRSRRSSGTCAWMRPRRASPADQGRGWDRAGDGCGTAVVVVLLAG
jgi:hypothetical protein